MIKISKRKQVEKYCSNKYRKNTTLGCTKNGSERFRFRNGSERFRTVLNYLPFLVLSTKNGSERFPGRCLGAVFWHMVFPYENFKLKTWS